MELGNRSFLEACIRPTRLSGILVVIYLLVLLHAFALVRAVMPRVCRVARLERRWLDLWMR